MPDSLESLVEKQRLHLCKDCRWHVANDDTALFGEPHCTEPRAMRRSPITGDRLPGYCSIQRTAELTGCGEAAKWFQPGDGIAEEKD
jgi:hypothetical protein